MRIAFMGTPGFAVPSLNALLDAGHEVVGVFTQPDRPAGRGNRLTPCPVKQLALSRGVPVYQFEKLKSDEGVACLKGLTPELCVTAAFGQLLSQRLLDVPLYGTVNVHASLLPRHRGPAPINWCIVQGDKLAGVTTMLTDIGMDTGDMLLQASTPIGELETAGELAQRLADIGAQLLLETLARYPHGDLVPTPQDNNMASYEPMLRRDAGLIDWTRPASELANQIRGLNPWPGAFTDFDGGRLKLHLARPRDAASDAAPGTVTLSNPRDGLCVACGDGWLEILEIQAPNARRMSAKAYLQGHSIPVGIVLG